jgi:hypothetical protein
LLIELLHQQVPPFDYHPYSDLLQPPKPRALAHLILSKALLAYFTKQTAISEFEQVLLVTPRAEHRGLISVRL